MGKRLGGWVLLAAAIVQPSACSSSSSNRSSPPCAAGRSQSCTALSGCSGVQICKSDGSGFEPCMCLDAGSGGSGGSAGSPTGGNSGAGGTAGAGTGGGGSSGAGSGGGGSSGTNGASGTSGASGSGARDSGMPDGSGGSTGGTAGNATGGTAGSGGSGGATLPTCDAFCMDNVQTCTGSNAAYMSQADCNNACSNWPRGTVGQSSGNTLGCRVHHLGVAKSTTMMLAKETHCPHTGVISSVCQ